MGIGGIGNVKNRFPVISGPNARSPVPVLSAPSGEYLLVAVIIDYTG